VSHPRKLYKFGKSVIDKILSEDSVEMTKTITKKRLLIVVRFGMDAFWTILSENSDPNGIRFVSTLEAKDYPFYAIQYHPEKSSYTWTDQPGQQILHSKEATHSALYLSQFLASLARQSQHKFPTRTAEESTLIYNYDVFFTGREEVNSSNTQVYLFH